MDKKLQEAMARAIDPHNCNWENGLSGPAKEKCRKQAQAAYDAIQSSGTHMIVGHNERLLIRDALYVANNLFEARKSFTESLEAENERLRAARDNAMLAAAKEEE